VNVAKVAASFVDLALSHDGWNEVEQLPSEELQILFRTVSAAGFKPKAVVLGKLKGDWLDQDGSRTGQTYPINHLSPVKVMGQDGDNYFATGWLDCALIRVVGGAKRGEDRNVLVKAVESEIRRSVPLPPIQLTPDRDLLREYPPRPIELGALPYFVDHSRDGEQLSTCVGVHAYCGSWMDRVRATATHDAIVCRGCHLRVLFPKGIKTYGQLRQHLAAERIQTPA
jgi:hypothetical protein